MKWSIIFDIFWANHFFVGKFIGMWKIIQRPGISIEKDNPNISCENTEMNMEMLYSPFSSFRSNKTSGTTSWAIKKKTGLLVAFHRGFSLFIS